MRFTLNIYDIVYPPIAVAFIVNDKVYGVWLYDDVINTLKFDFDS
jgi:hypothetical protein